MKRVTIGFGLAVALAAWSPAARTQDEAAEYYGTYQYVSGQEGDTPVSKGRLTGTVRITRDMVFLLDSEGKETFAISYTVDSEEEPNRVSMRIERSIMEDAVGATAKGLAKHENGTITLIYDYSENPNYPDDFEPEAQQHLFVLKKAAGAR